MTIGHQLRHLTFLTSSLVLCLSFVGGCSEDDKDGGSGDGDAEGSGGTGLIVVGDGDGDTGDGDTGDGDTGNGNGNLDGGREILSDDEVEDLTKESCTGNKYEGEVLPSVIQLVIDVSSSMRSTAPGSTLSKWEVTRDLLLEGIVGVEGTGLPPSVGVGMLFYPNRTDIVQTEEPQDVSACVNVDEFVAPQLLGGRDASHRELVRTSIQNAITETWTPTHDAFRYALREGLLQKEVTAPNKFMLLITDGTPTFSLDCTQPNGVTNGVDPEPIVDEVAYAASQGVRTFLIGSPGSEPNRNWMSRAAVIGGTAPAGCSVNGPVGEYCHMDMTAADDFTKALRDGLARIAGVISTCAYDLADAPNGTTLKEDEVVVLMKKPDGSNVQLFQDSDADCTEGWHFNESGQVELCRDTCDEVQLENQTTVEVVLGCDKSVTIK